MLVAEVSPRHKLPYGCPYAAVPSIGHLLNEKYGPDDSRDPPRTASMRRPPGRILDPVLVRRDRQCGIASVSPRAILSLMSGATALYSDPALPDSVTARRGIRCITAIDRDLIPYFRRYQLDHPVGLRDRIESHLSVGLASRKARRVQSRLAVVSTVRSVYFLSAWADLSELSPSTRRLLVTENAPFTLLAWIPARSLSA